jgi:hypothetical protein
LYLHPRVAIFFEKGLIIDVKFNSLLPPSFHLSYNMDKSNQKQGGNLKNCAPFRASQTKNPCKFNTCKGFCFFEVVWAGLMKLRLLKNMIGMSRKKWIFGSDFTYF